MADEGGRKHGTKGNGENVGGQDGDFLNGTSSLWKVEGFGLAVGAAEDGRTPGRWRVGGSGGGSGR